MHRLLSGLLDYDLETCLRRLIGNPGDSGESSVLGIIDDVKVHILRMLARNQSVLELLAMTVGKARFESEKMLERVIVINTIPILAITTVFKEELWKH